MSWFIDSWAARDGFAFISRRDASSGGVVGSESGGQRFAELILKKVSERLWRTLDVSQDEGTATPARDTVHVSPPYFHPVPVGRPSTAFWPTRGHFQEGFLDEFEQEYAFSSLEQAIETVRRVYLASRGGNEPTPMLALEPTPEGGGGGALQEPLSRLADYLRETPKKDRPELVEAVECYAEAWDLREELRLILRVLPEGTRWMRGRQALGCVLGSTREALADDPTRYRELVLAGALFEMPARGGPREFPLLSLGAHLSMAFGASHYLASFRRKEDLLPLWVAASLVVMGSFSWTGESPMQWVRQRAALWLASHLPQLGVLPEEVEGEIHALVEADRVAREHAAKDWETRYVTPTQERTPPFEVDPVFRTST